MPEEHMPPTEHEVPRNRQARDYESTHNRLFLIRLALTVCILAAYLLSGASAQLAAGLRTRFGNAWLLVNGLYTIVTIFGFAAFMFPLSVYSEHTLEHRYGLSRQSFEGWFFDYLKSLLIELVLAVLFVEAIYVFLRYAPNLWWIWATIFYVAVAVVLTAIAPVLIMPLFHKFEPLQNAALTDRVRTFAESAGLRVIGVFRWGLEEKTATGNAALTGIGRTRRIVLGDTLLEGYSEDEILAILAHEIGHYRHRDLARLILSGSITAAAGFYITHRVLGFLVNRFGFAGVDDIASFPLLVFCLLLFSLFTMPVSNGYSRRREFAADAYAVAAMGGPEPLVSALEKLADQNLSDRDPPRWIEWLLHSHPSIGRRVARARNLSAPRSA
jgi:STE24 endopeptidase